MNTNKPQIERNIDVHIKIEPCDINNEVQDVNYEIKNHVDHTVNNELVSEPETFNESIDSFLQKNEVISSKDLFEDNEIKSEQFEDDSVDQYQQKNDLIINNVDLCKDHEIKNELDIGPEIKHEIKDDIDPEDEDDFVNQYIKNEQIVNKDVLDLYKDHEIKEELVIGPEVIQRDRAVNTEELVFHPKTEKQQYLKIKIKREKNDTENSFRYQIIKEELDDNQNEKINMYLKMEEDVTSETTKYKNIGKKEPVIKFQESDNTSPESQASNGFKCHQCNKCFSFPGNLKRHIKTHSDKKPHQCSECDLSFARKDYLAFHLYKHHSHIKPPYIRKHTPASCDLCKKEFSKKCARDFHRKHSCPLNKNKVKVIKNKLYICDVCDKTYVYRSSLSAHIVRRHTTCSIGRMHECDYCGKKYAKKHNLQCHIQSMHMNYRPYKCKKCKEAFTWHSCLAIHERKVHGAVKKKQF